MFVSKDLVFMELHKTGSSHIRRTLKELLDGEIVGHHNRAPRKLFAENRKFIGSVRNPWDWYVSLWAYGCDKKGAIFDNVTLAKESGPANSQQDWVKTYADVDDKEAFRQWLHMMHDEQNFPTIESNYAQFPLSRVAGLFSFRYLSLFCTKVRGAKKLRSLSIDDEIKNYEAEFCFIDRFIHLESLEADLFRVLEDFAGGVSDKTKSEVLSRKKSNASSRIHGAEYYYDQKSADLIAAREKLIIDKFGYEAPC